MIHIKLYEELKDNPQVGDYIWCFDNLYGGDLLNRFLENNVGICIGISVGEKYEYNIKFENVPENIKNRLTEDMARRFDRSEILYFSPDKEQVEAYIASKKYNL